jgi:flavodoxin
MKTVVIYQSRHQGNTEKIATEMARVLNAELRKPDAVDIHTIAENDLIGFGSGIYWGKHDKRLFNLIDRLPLQKGKKAFIFATSGREEGRVLNKFNKRITRKLLAKGFTLVGEFSCRGFDTVGPLKLIGGIHKGRPNKADLEAAARFAKDLL